MKNSKFKKILTASVVMVALVLSTVIGSVVVLKNRNGKSGPASLDVWDGVTTIRPTGDGCADDPFVIENGANLAYVSQEMDLSNAYYYTVVNDIDLGGHDWVSIGDKGNEFSGIFYGNGYTISNIGVAKDGYYNEDRQAPSLFGNVWSGVIDGINVKYSFNEASEQSGFGGIIRKVHHNVYLRNCANLTPAISFTATRAVECYGGLIGCAYKEVDIANSYSLMDITFNGVSAGVGGLVGGFTYGPNSIRNSYCAGKIVASEDVECGNIVGSGYNKDESLSCVSFSNAFSTYDIAGSETNPNNKWSTLLSSGSWVVDPSINNGMPTLKVDSQTSVGTAAQVGNGIVTDLNSTSLQMSCGSCGRLNCSNGSGSYFDYDGDDERRYKCTHTWYEIHYSIMGESIDAYNYQAKVTFVAYKCTKIFYWKKSSGEASSGGGTVPQWENTAYSTSSVSESAISGTTKYDPGASTYYAYSDPGTSHTFSYSGMQGSDGLKFPDGRVTHTSPNSSLSYVNITYESALGTTPTSGRNMAVGASLATMTASGNYTHVGWKVIGKLTGSATGWASVSDSTIYTTVPSSYGTSNMKLKLKAVWQQSVTLYGLNSAKLTTLTFTYGDAPTISSTYLSKTGYTCDGVYNNSSYSTQYFNSSGTYTYASTWTQTSVTALYIKFTAISTTISASTTSVSKTYGYSAFDVATITASGGGGRWTYGILSGADSHFSLSSTTATTGTVTLKFSAGANAGTYTATVKALSAYNGTSATKQVTVRVEQAASTITLNFDCSAPYCREDFFQYKANLAGTWSISITSGSSYVSVSSYTTSTNADTYYNCYIYGKEIGSGVVTLTFTPSNSNYKSTSTTKSVSCKKASLGNPRNLSVSSEGVVTWSSVSYATGYQISIDNSNWSSASSGINYNSTICADSGQRTVYVRAIADTNHYIIDSPSSVTVTVCELKVNYNTYYDPSVHSANLNVGASGCVISSSSIAYGSTSYVRHISSSTAIDVTISRSNSNYNYYLDYMIDSTYVDYGYNNYTYSWTPTANRLMHPSVLEYFTANAMKGTGADTATFSTAWFSTSFSGTYTSSDLYQGTGIQFTTTGQTGYRFKGWYDNENGTGTAKSTNTTYTYCTYANPGGGGLREDITLYAIWTPNTYTVTLNKGTGISAVSGAGTYAYGASVTISATVASGYSWSKWTGTHSTTTQKYTFTMPASNVTDTANATVNSYTVTLNKGTGISAVSGAGTYAYGASVTINATVASGYSWSKWTGTHSTTTQKYTFTMPASNVTDTANATVNSYTVTLNKGTGISAVSGAGTYAYGASVTINATVASGYSWSKWTGTHSTTTQKYTFTMPASNVTDTANATVNSYTVTFNPNGGSVSPTSKSVTYNSTYGDLPTPTKTGYTFGGWVNNYLDVADMVDFYTEKSPSGVYRNPSLVGDVLKICGPSAWDSSTSAHVVYPYTFVTDATYKVSYYAYCDRTDGNSTTGLIVTNATGTTTCAGDSNVSATTRTYYSYTFTATDEMKGFSWGYNYGSWAWFDTILLERTDALSTSTITSTSTVKTGVSHTLVAQWTANTYTVTYNANGGSGTMSNTTATYGQTATISANTFTRTGYTFSSWSTSRSAADSNGWTNWSGTWSYIDGQYGISGGVLNLYAIWTPVSYSISYTLNGGSVSTANPTSYTIETSSITLNNPTRAGYTFAGWTGSNGTTAQKSVTIAKGSTGNRSYTANWTANTYTISYNGNGNTGGSTASSSHTYDTAEALTSNGFTKTGYSFAGWATSASGSVAYSNGQSVKNLSSTQGATVTLYAKWTANTYTVTYNANGGSGTMSNTTATYGQTATISANTFTRTGYTFSSWSTSRSAADSNGWTNWSGTWSYIDGQYGISGGVLNLYAIWTAIDTTISTTATSVTKTYGYTDTSVATITAGDGGSKWTYSLVNTSSNATSYFSLSSTSATTGTVTLKFATGASVGTYKTQVKATSAYNGTYATTATITVTISTAGITVSASGYSGTYDGKAHSASITVSAPTGTTIKWGTTSGSYTNTLTTSSTTSAYSMGSRTDVGTTNIYYQVSKSNYTTVTGSVTIKIDAFDLSKATMTLSVSSAVYTGSSITPTATVKVTLAGTSTTLTKDTHYTISYSNNTSVGTATVTATGKGNFTGTQTATFSIIKATITIPSSPADKTYNGASQGCGIATPANASVVTASSTTSATNVGNYTVLYKLNDTSNYKWSNDTTTNISVTWKIVAYNLSGATVGSISDSTFKGSPITPTPTITVPIPSGSTTTLIKDTDYTLSYSNNSNAGTATVTATGKGNYTGTKTANFTINKYNLSNATITLSVSSAVYTSSAITPTAIVKMNSTTLTKGTHYTLSYSNNTNVGTATVTATAIDGTNYTGSKSTTFKIYYPTLTVKGASGSTVTADQTAYPKYNTKNIYTTDTGSTAKTLSIPSKPGYTFQGWYTEESGGTQILTNAGALVSNWDTTSNMTVYPQFTINSYTLTINPNGGEYNSSTSNTTVKQDFGTTYTVATPTRTGYTFAGWTNSGSGSLSGTTYTFGAGAGTLTAKWTANTYTVTANANGGTIPATTGWTVASGSATATKSVTYDSTYGTLPEPTRNGYNFNGWYTATSGGSKVLSTTKVTTASAYTIYAQWTAKKITVSFNANGGSVSTTSAEVTFDGSYGILPTATRAGYTFAGWYTASSGGSKVESTTKVTNAANHTLYAQWDVVTYTISYTLGGGSVSTANPTSYTIETADFTLNNPTKVGYTFVGWTGSNGTTAQTTVTIAKGSTGNKSYTANWTSIGYTIYIDENGGATVSDLSYLTSASQQTKTLPTVTRTGYTFASWAITTNSSEANSTVSGSTLTIPANAYGNITVKANWNVVTYTISYNLNGGSVSTANPTSYTIETVDFTLNNPTKAGYTFAGWTGSNGTTAQTTVKIAKGSIGDKSYTANWTFNALAESSSNGYTGIYDGASHNISFVASHGSSNTISYQWYKDSVATANKISGATSTIYSVTNVADSGTYVCRATISDGTTTKTLDKSLTVKITAKDVAVTWGTTTSWTYDGNSHVPTASATGVTGETIKLTISGEQTNVGNYTATASISSVTGGQAKTSNYTLTNTTKAFSITQSAGAVITANNVSAIYNGSEIAYSTAGGNASVKGVNGESVTGSITYYYSTSENGTYTQTAPTNAGTHYVKISYSGDSNYASAYKIATLTINKLQIMAVAMNNYGTDATTKSYITKTYDGTTTVATTLANKTHYKLQGIKTVGESYTDLTNDEITKYVTRSNGVYASANAGNPNVTVTFGVVSEMTNNIDLKTTSLALNGQINKKSTTITWSGLTATYTYNGTNQGSKITATYAGINSTTLSATITFGGKATTFTNAGSYTVTATVGSNYVLSNDTQSESKTVVMNKASISPTISMSDYTFAGTISSPSISGNTGSGTVTYYYSNTNTSTGGTKWANMTATSLAVGKYYMYATVGATDNYNGATTSTVSFNVKVNKIATPTGLKWTDSVASWTAVSTTASYTYTVVLYNGTTAVKTLTSVNGTSQDMADYFNAVSSSWKFTVQVVTTNSNYENSAVATSGTTSVYSLTAKTSTGISAVTPATAQYGVAGKSIAISATVSDGYTWSKWEVFGTTPTTFTATTQEQTVVLGAGSVTLTATTTANQYTLTINPNSGKYNNTTSNTTVTQNIGTTYTVANPTRDGYTFAGWTNSGSGSLSGTTYTFGAGAGTLKANWTIVTYSIAYTLNGGAVSTANPKTYTIETVDFTLNNPTKAGYTFAGWTGSNGTTAQTTVKIAKGSIGDKSYTANWTFNALAESSSNGYTGTYDGASHNISFVASHGSSNTISYQWYKGSVADANKISGATKTTYSVKNVADSGTYVCRATISDGTTTKTLDKSLTVTIKQKALTDNTANVTAEYDGTSKTITISLSGFVTGESMSLGTITYYTSNSYSTTTTQPSRKDVGTTTVYYKVTFANYATVSGSKTITINGFTPTVTLTAYSAVYSGSAIKFTDKNVSLTGVSGGTTPSGTLSYLYKSAGGTYTSTAPTTVGTYTVKVTVGANGNYKEISAETTLTITKSVITISATTEYGAGGSKYIEVDYDGKVEVSKSKAIKGTHYTISATGCVPSDGNQITINNFSAGLSKDVQYSGTSVKGVSATARIVLNDTTNFAFGSATSTATYFDLSINIKKMPLNLSSATISGVNAEYTYTGSAITPTITLKCPVDGTITTLVLNTDYTVEYSNNTSAGTATITATGKGNFTGTKTATFAIAQYNISGATVSTIADQTYTGSAIQPAFTVTMSGKTLTAGTDYTVAYTNNTNAGTATITLTGKGNFTGTKTVNFAIKPATVTVPSNPADKTYNSASQGCGVTTPTHTTVVTGSTTSATNVGTYTVTYALDSKTNYVWSDGTTANKSISWKIVAFNISKATVTQIADQVYTGSAIEKTTTVTVTLNGASHTLTSDEITYSYSSDTTNVGKVTVTITGKGNFTGTVTTTYNIVYKSITGTATITGTAQYGDTLTASVTNGLAGATVSYQWQYSTSASGTWTNCTNGTSSTFAITSANVGNATVVGKVLRVVISGTGNYSGTLNSTETSSVTAKALTWETKPSVANKVYDSNTTATISSHGSITGVISGDTTTLSTSNAKATFNNATVGSSKAITFTDYALTGTNAGNYSLAQPTGVTANITKLQVTVSAYGNYSTTATNKTYIVKAYDGTTSVSALTKGTHYSVSSSLASVTYTASYANVNVQTGLINNITATFTLSDTTNMEFTTGGNTITLNGKITPIDKSVVWETETSYTYTGSAQQVKAYYTNLSGTKVYMDVTFSGQSTTFKDAGTYTATATAKSSDTTSVNYTIGNTTKSEIVIGTKAITITWTGGPYTYNTNAQGPSYTTSGVVSTDSANVTFTASDNSKTNVGTYTATVTMSGDRSRNYHLTNASYNWEIKSSQLTKPAITGTYTYTGSELTASLSNFDATTMTVSDNKQTNAGKHTVTVALKDKANYTWSDGKTTDITLDWTIAKATNSTVSLSQNSIAVKVGETVTLTATVSYVGTHTATSVTTSGVASTYATISASTLSNKTSTITIVGVKCLADGTVTVTLPEDSNHTAVSANFTLRVNIIQVTMQVVDKSGNIATTKQGAVSYDTYTTNGTNVFEVPFGASRDLTLTPNANYGWYYYEINGTKTFNESSTDLTATKKVTLPNITENTTVKVYFAPTIVLNFKLIGDSNAMSDKNVLKGTKDDKLSVAMAYTFATSTKTYFATARVFADSDIYVSLGGISNKAERTAHVITSITFGANDEIISGSQISVDTTVAVTSVATQVVAGNSYDVVYNTQTATKLESGSTDGAEYILDTDAKNKIKDRDGLYIVDNSSVTITVKITDGYTFVGFMTENNEMIYRNDTETLTNIVATDSKYSYSAEFSAEVARLTPKAFKNNKATITSSVSNATGTLTHVESGLIYNVTSGTIVDKTLRVAMLQGEYKLETKGEVTITITTATGKQTISTNDTGIYTFAIDDTVTSVEISIVTTSTQSVE